MNLKDTFKIAAIGDTDLSIIRVFKAPKEMVFDAYTKPELLRRWLLGPDLLWKLEVCDVDLRVGGKYRYEWKHPKKSAMGMGGKFLEIEPAQKIVQTEVFDQAWYEGAGISTLMLEEKDGFTTAINTVRYESKATRDVVLKSPMDQGLIAGYNRLDDIFAERK